MHFRHVFLHKAIAVNLPDKERQIGMSLIDRFGFFKILLPLFTVQIKMYRLRKYDDPIMRKGIQCVAEPLLLIFPKIAKISAAIDCNNLPPLCYPGTPILYSFRMWCFRIGNT